jgi:isopenicillin-N epimerase
MSNTRRNFLKQIGASAGMSALYMSGTSTSSLAAQDVRAMAAGAQGSMHDNEAFWDRIRNEFIIEDKLIMMNAANMTPSPKVVHETVIDHTRDMDMNCSFQNRGKYGDLTTKAREFIAGFLGADTDEIGFVRNTSEANNTVINGLDLGAGDEVLIWDQNHPCNNIAWHQRAERLGFTVVTVSTDETLNTIDDLLRPFKEAINSNTKILAFSHVSNVTGTALPGKEMTQLAHANGAKCLVDGAQTFGYMDIDLHDMGCDFYTSSGQKWILGPREASFVYVKREAQAELWPNIVTVGWARNKANGAQKYESLGQRDDGRLWALGRAVEFHQMIGQDRIEARINYLASVLRANMVTNIPNIKVLTEQAEGFNSGIFVGLIPNTDAPRAARTIYDQHRISGAIGGREDVLRVRLCPHIYNSVEQMGQIADYIKASI